MVEGGDITMKSKEIKKTNAIVAILFSLCVASVSLFCIGILTENTILATLGAVLYYLILIYVLVDILRRHRDT